MMKFFRIHIYLSLKNFFKAVFIIFYKKEKVYENAINKILLKNSNKSFSILTSQCRIGLLLILKYLKFKFSKKNEIIFPAYNLPEMINVAKNLSFKVVLCDCDYKTGFYNLEKLKKKINKKTSAIILTNMFNSYEQSISLKKICTSKKVYLIEDNAIYFDNYKISKKNKKYSGTIGDFSLYSFNIMKNISALYGGAVTSSIREFDLFSKENIYQFENFYKIILLKQIIIFLILKILSVNLFYKHLFFKIIKYSYFNNVNFLQKLFYPSLKFKIIKFPSYYFTKISFLSKKLIFYQLTDSKTRNFNHKKRKFKNYYYYNSFYKNKINGIKLFNITDFNYQNFIDFPLLARNRGKLNKFLLTKGIESRLYYYRNCEKIFYKNKKLKCLNSEKFENEVICLPNGDKTTLEYIDYIVKMILIFYSKNQQ